MEATHFLIKRDDWRTTRLIESSEPDQPEPGKIVVRVVHVAFTANNISYIKTGDSLRYWDFWPAEDGWGRVPCMGFGEIVQSAHPDLPAGARVFGWFPLSHRVTMTPDQVSPRGFIDAAPHRKGLAPVYNTYNLVDQDPGYAREHEDKHMLLRGLFITSYLVDDFLDENLFFGARTVIVASASSKTAIALAFRLAKRDIRIVGLTSPRNLFFVNGLGLYSKVWTYADLEQINADEPAVLVDMAGNGDVVNRLHHHLGNNMKYSCLVGATHWDAAPREKELPGAKPQFFFAPGQIERRASQMGMAALQQKMIEAWIDFRDSGSDWLRVTHGRGADAVARVYRETLAGHVAPDQGQVLSMWEN